MNKIIKINNKYSYNELKSDLEFLKYEYSNLKVGSIGKSILGEKINYIKLGEGRNKIFINASHHANEEINSLVLMMFVENYLELKRKNKIYKGYNIQELWDKTSLYIVPMVNPDGINLCLQEINVLIKEEYRDSWYKYKNELNLWKSNIRGVDLNLNYPIEFEKIKKIKANKEIIKPGPRDYPGYNYLSEPETKKMYEFSKIHNFNLSISLHSQGEEIYGENEKNKNSESYKLGKKFEKVSGYKYKTPEDMESFVGYKDWFISEFKKPRIYNKNR